MTLMMLIILCEFIQELNIGLLLWDFGLVFHLLCLLTLDANSPQKYNPPRTWTPRGTVGMGGSSTAIYRSFARGYQIFGRTPVPIWDPEKDFQFLKIVFVSLDQVIVLNLTLALMKSLMKSKEK